MNPGEPQGKRSARKTPEPDGGGILRSACLGPGVAVLLSLGCGSTLYLAANGRSARPPVEVFDCVKSQIPVLGYTQTSIDVESHRITARKHDREARFADTRFQRMIERLTIEIGSAAGGGAQLRIDAHTFAELATQRGPTEIEQEASPAVRAAAQKLLEACGT
jgi:hypothetical protein